jgi:hypothetical protein
MKNENYHISITVKADAKKAVNSICNVADWWTSNIEGNSKNLNDVFTIHFGETFVTFKITELIPERKIVWAVTDCNLHWLNDKKEWNNTKVEWQISASDGSSNITMIHDGLIPAAECYENCEKGWNFFTGESLKKLINEGQGMPETPKAARV